MSLFGTILDYARELFDMLVSLAGFIIRKTGEYSLIALEWFKNLPLSDELIIINGLPAIGAVILPAARFYIFESWYEVNNPLSVWMIGVGFVMFATIFFRERVWTAPVRIGVCLYYLGWALYMGLGGHITKADGAVVTGFYMLNYIVPSVYAGLAVFSWLQLRRS